MDLESFQTIQERAARRHGGDGIAGAGDHPAKTPDELAAIPDGRYLSMATRCIFQSGFNWKVVEAKWPGFEEAFGGFALHRWTLAADDELDALLSDKRVIRNAAKLASVPANARFFAGISAQAGSVGRWIGDWPQTDLVGLIAALEKGGSRLGGLTGQYFLRFMGKDCFILSRDVTAALVHAGVIAGPASSRRSLALVQEAFNRWNAETGLPWAVISRTLARSIDAPAA